LSTIYNPQDRKKGKNIAALVGYSASVPQKRCGHSGFGAADGHTSVKGCFNVFDGKA